MATCNQRIADSISLYDNEFYKTISSLLEKPKVENSGDIIDDSSNKICNKMSLIGHASHFLYKVSLNYF